jgi:plastocyanin
MRRAIPLVALVLLPLAFLSLRAPRDGLEATQPAVSGSSAVEALGLTEATIQDSYTVSGTVYLRKPKRDVPDEYDMVPFPGAVVSVRGTVVSTTTDSDGRYRLPVPRGSRFMLVQAPGFRTQVFRAPDNSTSDFDFTIFDNLVVVVPFQASPDTVRLSVANVQGVQTVVVDPDPLYIAPGDSIFWVSETGPWAVHFLPTSPLYWRRITGGPGDRVGHQVRSDVHPGKYTYFVAVERNDTIFTEDPELIDENGEGEPPPGGNQ